MTPERTERQSDIKIINISSDQYYTDGIFKFENCIYLDRNQIVKNASCCSSQKVAGYFCKKIKKFPVSFSEDCQGCAFFQK
jgi:hypothetical protein